MTAKDIGLQPGDCDAQKLWSAIPAPTRPAGLARLADFLPLACDYGRERNRAVPPHGSVSRLSAHLRHRLILERELVTAVIDAHGPGPVHKLITEVLWRTYWKGWLEQRPQVWGHWLGRLGPDLDQLGADAQARYQAAITGRTGIACFDAWAGELIATGYLHNHVRMWFASIWIFTLELPWTLGAAFFLRHLLDGDPASNTCSWRWVAGLHTRGKHYLAKAENIARWTDGQFDPVGQLNESAGPLVETGLDLDPRPMREPAGPDPNPDPDRPSGLLLTPDDLAPEHSGLAGMPIRGIAGGPAQAQAHWLDQARMVQTFVDSALSEALTRAGGALQAPVQRLGGDHWLAAAEDWALGLGIRQVLTLDAPIGPWRDRLDRLELRLAERDIRLARVRRPWDQTLWPLARKGYFRFREQALAAAGPTPLLRSLLTPEQGPPR